MGYQGSSYLKRAGRSHFSLRESLGRSEILAGRSEILAATEMRLNLPRQLSLYCLYLSPIYLFLSYLYTM